MNIYILKYNKTEKKFPKNNVKYKNSKILDIGIID